ncbi:unnamed protein product [Candidula unifasciata]|uniref:Cation/H+ exchanger transmembrane domain-containing protein n=1 Tax=Candidula unifasciata TaxID=100452 RepID=A0A8S3ZM80_9EUPU|nr:unnamed protein product [Candidula unifasciata]
MSVNPNSNGIIQHPNKSTTSRCSSVTALCSKCFRPLLASSHPLPENPSIPRQIGQWFFFPPSGKVAAVLLACVLFASWWAVLISISKTEALPGGSLFPMLILFIGSWCVGGLLGNIPGIDVARQIKPIWSSTARNIALTVILTRAGLGLDPVALKRLSFVVLRLAFCPSIAEVTVDAVAARFILDLPWTWAFMLAFVLSVVSPAVVVPSLLGLSERGYGLNKGIPTLVIAACSLDAVLAITGFGVMLGISFSSGDLVWTVFKGPLEALVGVAFGLFYGVLLWYLPQKSSKNLVLFRSALLLAGGLMAIFGSKAIDWSGSGPLGCLTVAFVAAFRWKDEYRSTGQKNPVEDVTAVLWMVFQPLLFGLIGSAVNISSLESDTVGFGIAILFLGLTVRMVVAYLTVLRTELNVKERFFIPLSWFPKATVQAAIGAIAYDTAVEKGAADLIPLGKQILTIAVLAILIAAPIGSILITVVGPRLLHRTDSGQPISDDIQKTAMPENCVHTNCAAEIDDEKLDQHAPSPMTKL